MGIATQVEAAVDLMLSTFVSAKSAALCVALVPLALSGATIYMLMMGYAIMRGEANDSLHTFVWKSFKIAFIAGLALSAGAYQTHVIDGIEGIQGAFIQTMSGAATIGGLVDNMAQPFDELGTALWAKATTGFWPNFSLLAAAAMVAIAQAFLFVVGLGFYLLAKVALALVFAMGPAFILCAMWPATQKYTESWLGQALNYVILNVLVGASIAMLTAFASQFAGHITATQDTTNVLKATMALLLCSGALAVVMLNLPQLAGALAGGASLSGIGRAVGRALFSGGGGKDKDKPKPNEGGEIEDKTKPKDKDKDNPGPQGRNDSSNGPGGQTQQPLYQRHTIDHIRNAA
jgi:type IV secretion system protein VirB6